MFFKGYFNSVADIMEARIKGYERDRINPADRGELCEIFIKEFIQDALGDNFRIFRGGKVVNSGGMESKQIDIVLCSKRTIKIFADKGIYPIETVKGVFSVTSTLGLKKLDQCMKEFNSIPKTGYHFISQMAYPEKFRIETQRVFENLTPITCIFAYRGNIQSNWVDHIVQWINQNNPHLSLTPDIIVVNKKGMIFKKWQKKGENSYTITYEFVDFKITKHPGDAFSRMLNELYNLSHEEMYLLPDYTYYFNKDLIDNTL